MLPGLIASIRSIIILPSAMAESWKFFRLVRLPALCSFELTHCTISFSMIGLPVLASRDRIDSVYARISCQMSASVSVALPSLRS
uniref:Putative secreted protein n=1 Tax=Anopheles triannulatus TaxID=58253 RepID=A0A2M4B141_9DIPT